MHKCHECGCEFAEPMEISYITTEGGIAVAAEYTQVCPACKSDDIDPMEHCPQCGEYVEELELCGCCEQCAADLQKRFSALLHANFTHEEIAMLNELYDGETLC